MIIEEFKYEIITPSYTFQDWLDDDIDYEINNDFSLKEESRALYAAKWISEEDYKKIIECQVRAYDTAVEETFNTFIWDFLINYNNSPYKTEYLVNEIKTAQEIIDKNPKEMYHVLAGQKDFTKICGGRCQEIMERKNKTGHHFFYRDNDNIRMTAQYKYLKWLECFKPEGKNHLLDIPTKATSDEILNFWLKMGNNKKGNPCWPDREEIEHFIYQNFEKFPGVPKIKMFTPNMTKTELYKKTYDFFNKYGIHGTKQQYVKLLQLNFTKLRGIKEQTIYSNIAFK